MSVMRISFLFCRCLFTEHEFGKQVLILWKLFDRYHFSFGALYSYHRFLNLRQSLRKTVQYSKGFAKRTEQKTLTEVFINLLSMSNHA